MLKESRAYDSSREDNPQGAEQRAAYVQVLVCYPGLWWTCAQVRKLVHPEFEDVNGYALDNVCKDPRYSVGRRLCENKSYEYCYFPNSVPEEYLHDKLKR